MRELKDSFIHVKIPSRVKENAQEIVTKMGYTLSEYIRKKLEEIVEMEQKSWEEFLNDVDVSHWRYYNTEPASDKILYAKDNFLVVKENLFDDPSIYIVDHTPNGIIVEWGGVKTYIPSNEIGTVYVVYEKVDEKKYIATSGNTHPTLENAVAELENYLEKEKMGQN